MKTILILETVRRAPRPKDGEDYSAHNRTHSNENEKE